MTQSMTKNVGSVDRIARAVVATGLGFAAIFAPLPFWARALGLGLNAVYLGYTALSGTCLGYRLLGKSTCPTELR
jgi:hypothetical protein